LFEENNDKRVDSQIKTKTAKQRRSCEDCHVNKTFENKREVVVEATSVHCCEIEAAKTKRATNNHDEIVPQEELLVLQMNPESRQIQTD
jgi:hypothetical protein